MNSFPNTPVFPKSINTFFVITDGKMDDSLGIKVLLKYISKNYSESYLHFLITDIVDRQGCANYINGLCEVLLNNYKIGKVNLIFHEGNEDPCAPKDKKVKNHEEMFNAFTFKKVNFVPIEPMRKKYICFAIAPFQNYKKLVISASHSFMGLGYNTSDLDIDFYCSVKSVMHLINNRSETIYPDKKEGGRFSVDDSKLWDAVYKDSDGILKKVREFALKDSKAFGIKQLFKAGVLNSKIIQQEVFKPKIIEQAKEAFKNNPNHYYLPRVIEQLEQGAWDVECSDGQHMAAWLEPSLAKSCILAKTKKPYLEILKGSVENEKFGIWCFAPSGMSLETMRENFLNYV